jgi:hypothetical protein
MGTVTRPRRWLATLRPVEAARYHWQAMRADPAHDRCSCWCCCTSCDFNAVRVLQNGLRKVAR